MVQQLMVDRRRNKDYIQVSLYLDREIHKKIKAMAALSGLSMSEFVEMIAIKEMKQKLPDISG